MLEDRHYQFLLEEVHRWGEDVFLEDYDVACGNMTIDMIKDWVKRYPGSIRGESADIHNYESALWDADDPTHNEERESIALEIFLIMCEIVDKYGNLK